MEQKIVTESVRLFNLRLPFQKQFEFVMDGKVASALLYRLNLYTPSNTPWANIHL